MDNRPEWMKPEWMKTDQDDEIEDAVFEETPPRSGEKQDESWNTPAEPRQSGEKQDESWNTPAEPPRDIDAVLGEHLAQCQKATRFALTFLYSRDTSFREGMQAIQAASGLMKLSVTLTTALKPKPREFIHRRIVEHAPATIGVTPKVEIGETSQGSREPETPNIE